jgi:hypothetical protein
MKAALFAAPGTAPGGAGGNYAQMLIHAQE